MLFLQYSAFVVLVINCNIGNFFISQNLLPIIVFTIPNGARRTLQPRGLPAGATGRGTCAHGFPKRDPARQPRAVCRAGWSGWLRPALPAEIITWCPLANPFRRLFFRFADTWNARTRGAWAELTGQRSTCYPRWAGRCGQKCFVSIPRCTASAPTVLSLETKSWSLKKHLPHYYWYWPIVLQMPNGLSPLQHYFYLLRRCRYRFYQQQFDARIHISVNYSLNNAPNKKDDIWCRRSIPNRFFLSFLFI